MLVFYEKQPESLVRLRREINAFRLSFVEISGTEPTNHDIMTEFIKKGYPENAIKLALFERGIFAIDEIPVSEQDRLPRIDELGIPDEMITSIESSLDDRAKGENLPKENNQSQDGISKDSKGSPTEALRIIYRIFGFKEFDKNKLYSVRKKYRVSTIDTEVRILRKLGILIMTKPGTYRLNPAIKGSTKEEAERNIAAIYNIKLKTGPKAKETPLDRYSIPKGKIPAVKECVKLELAHRNLEEALKAQVPEESTIKIWSGYARSTEQKTMLQRIRNIAPDKGYLIDFGNISDEEKSLKELVDFAISPSGKEGNTVTILPYTRPYVQEHIAELKKSNVVFMDYDGEKISIENFNQIGGIIATGIAYINNNDLAFMNLYRLLTGKDNPLAIEELKRNPEALIFILEPIKKIDTNDLRYLNERMEQLLIAA